MYYNETTITYLVDIHGDVNDEDEDDGNDDDEDEDEDDGDVNDDDEEYDGNDEGDDDGGICPSSGQLYVPIISPLGASLCPKIGLDIGTN